MLVSESGNLSSVSERRLQRQCRAYTPVLLVGYSSALRCGCSQEVRVRVPVCTEAAGFTVPLDSPGRDSAQ